MTTRSDAAAPKARDPRLDGLRGLAILLVVLFHATRFGPARGPLAIAATATPSLGWSGVDLFFVLSGFLITGILLRAKQSETYYRSFYVRRILRIFPLYYAALVLFLIVVPRLEIPELRLFSTEGATFWYWLFLANVKMALGAPASFLDVFWSLAVEEHFYLLWPWIVSRTSERQLLGVCGAIVAGALALRVAVVATDMNPLIAYVLTPCRLDTLATGAAIAVLARRPGGLMPLAGPARIALVVSLATLATGVGLARMNLVLPAMAHPAELARTIGLVMRPGMQTLGYSLLCVVFGSLLVTVLMARPEGSLARCFAAAPLRSLGLYSYSIYVFHIPIVMLIVRRWPFGLTPLPYLPWQLAIWALTLGVAYAIARLTWFALEAPAQRAKRWFPYGAKREPSGATLPSA